MRMPVKTKDPLKDEKVRDIEFIKREFEFRRGITPFVCSTGEDFKVIFYYFNFGTEKAFRSS